MRASLTMCLALGVTLGGCQPPAPTPGYPDYALPRLEGVTVPGLPPITSRIAVDQFGYLVKGDKVAIISDPRRGYNEADSYTPGPSLEVRTLAGEVVLSGPPTEWNGGAIHEDSGDAGWWFDFSALEEPGEYYVFDPSTGLRSPVFAVGDDVYDAVLRTAVRMYFYQRLSFPLEEPYAEAPWTVPSYMDQDRVARAVWDKDNPSTERDLSGGWMDAGDTNKYPPFNFDAVNSLLHAYEDNPEIFGDDFGIPESGNGLPDLLDEIKYQLDWMVKMQDYDGGVFIKMGGIDYNGANQTRYYAPKCTGATISVAAITAHAARVFGQFEAWKPFAAELETVARRAWAYYQSNPRTTDIDTGEVKSGIANRSLQDQDGMEAVAAIHLLALTGDGQFAPAIVAKAAATRQLSEGHWSMYGAGATEALTDYLSDPKADAELSARIRAQLAATVRSDFANPPVEVDLYRAYMNADAHHWGSNNVRATFGFVALYASEHAEGLAAEEVARMEQRARDMLHSFHGVNPLTAVYLTNMEGLGAELSMHQLYHERWGYGTPFATNPPPGYVVGGANQMFTGENGNDPGDVQWIKDQPRAKAYADINYAWPKASWELSENGIYYQAAYIRLLAGVLKRR